MNISKDNNKHLEREYFLGDVVGNRTIFHGTKIGVLSDFIFQDSEEHPEITHCIVKRPFGEKPYIFPVENIKVLTNKEMVINGTEDINKYEKEVPDNSLLLKDYILFKRILDLEGRETAVVYDVRIIVIENKFYISEVDLGKYRYFRRMGLIGDFINFINKITGRIREQVVSWKYIEPLSSDIDSFQGDLKLNILKERFEEMNPVDLADVLEELDSSERSSIFEELKTNHAATTLEEIDPYFQRELIESLPKKKIAQILDRMTSGQASNVLANLHYSERDSILRLMNPMGAAKIKSIINKQDEKILNYATLSIVTFPPNITIKQARSAFGEVAKYKKVVLYIYVVNKENVLLGVFDIKELLAANDTDILKDVMVENYVSLYPKNSFKKAWDVFNRYDFRALPIIDKNKKLLGVITYRDVKSLKNTLSG